MGDERRANPRFECELVAAIELGGITHAGRSADVSRGGVSLRIPVAVALGQPVHVLLTLGYGWTPKDFLRLPGKVVRCGPAGDDAHVIGVKFDPIDDPAARRQLGLLLGILGGELERELAAYRATSGT